MSRPGTSAGVVNRPGTSAGSPGSNGSLLRPATTIGNVTVNVRPYRSQVRFLCDELVFLFVRVFACHQHLGSLEEQYQRSLDSILSRPKTSKAPVSSRLCRTYIQNSDYARHHSKGAQAEDIATVHWNRRRGPLQCSSEKCPRATGYT